MCSIHFNLLLSWYRTSAHPASIFTTSGCYLVEAVQILCGIQCMLSGDNASLTVGHGRVLPPDDVGFILECDLSRAKPRSSSVDIAPLSLAICVCAFVCCQSGLQEIQYLYAELLVTTCEGHTV
eukprot:scpid35718/ scgid21870/ 